MSNEERPTWELPTFNIGACCAVHIVVNNNTHTHDTSVFIKSVFETKVWSIHNQLSYHFKKILRMRKILKCKMSNATY